jgi:uncharacterized membrane protein YbhN (UPF0104 family)
VSSAVEAVTPFRDRSRRRRLLKVLAWLLGVALLLVVLDLAGADILGWLESLLETVAEISVQYIVVGLALQTVQTTLTALGWYYILVAGYPESGVRYREILAAYTAGVAMNGFLPANIGTFATLLMYVALIRGATFPGVIGATLVQKIFFTAAGTAVYLYLFLSVPGSFDLQLGGISAHPVATISIVAGGAFLIAVLVRIAWRKFRGLWEKAKQGGAILADRRAYLVRVVLPSFGAWLAKLGVTAVFLAAYGIPVTFHTIMSVIGGNSLANTVSFTPGGVGITQAVNTISLESVTDTTTAAAYSLGQQIIVTAWNVVFATILVIWVFGWTGGKRLVETSYDDAKQKAADEKAQRAARKEAKRAEAGEGRVGRIVHRRQRSETERDAS